ncbi:MAG: type II secretion system F family protein [Moorellales bacterium]
MPLAVALEVFGAIFLLGVFLCLPSLPGRRLVEVLGTGVLTPREQELKKPFRQRALKPLLARWSKRLGKVLPVEKEKELRRRLDQAHLQYRLGPGELMVLKYLALVAGGTAAVLLGGAVAGSRGMAVLGPVGVLAGWYGPDLYLRLLARERQRRIEKSLPDVLDLLTVSVEAGLGFDGALAKIVEKSRGPLAEEFARVLQEIRMGKPRAEALRDLAGRTGVEDLVSFTGAVILADQLGLSLGNVLRLQARQMRQKRRQRAEELAMKAPVKMLLPLIFFIFPSIFVVLLGPALIQILQYLGRR